MTAASAMRSGPGCQRGGSGWDAEFVAAVEVMGAPGFCGSAGSVVRLRRSTVPRGRHWAGWYGSCRSSWLRLASGVVGRSEFGSVSGRPVAARGAANRAEGDDAT
ncbi:hypothetical protein GCM10018773_41380 [Streptomyces candidus]|nr:hypothetical protein GCM10018773_41380 [Streptomyces candidus]